MNVILWILTIEIRDDLNYANILFAGINIVNK